MVLVGAGFLKIGSGNAVADITAVFGSRSSVATHDRTGIRIADAKGFGVKNTIVTKGDRRTVDGFEGIAKFGIADVGIPGVGGIDSAGGGRIASGVGNGAGSAGAGDSKRSGFKHLDNIAVDGVGRTGKSLG